ncbi:MAG: polysaccharide deacetylase family protein [Desulfobulbaceae bacterium]|nr:polysaccharide deacetylase family protein [Desulfobulbaceae bacterium]
MDKVAGCKTRGPQILAQERGFFLRSSGRPFSPAERSGMLALGTAALFLGSGAPQLAALPLVLFVLACMGAPFFSGWSFFYRVFSHGRRDRPQISLSFDDGPDPLTTPTLLALLQQYGFCATFFVNGKKARQYPFLVEAILAQGHELGNHSYSHEACIMFRSPARILREIMLTQRVLARHGVVPALFRPPVGIHVPAYTEALHQSGLQAVNFSCRARDLGNRRVAGLAARILKKLRPGDIVLLHDVAPQKGGADGREFIRLWQRELEHIFVAICTRNLEVVPLGQLCSCRVMERVQKEEIGR